MIKRAPTAPSPQERIRGLLLGGAVGDALGAPVKDLLRMEILRRFGPEGITAFAPAFGRIGAITDVTQMTLFTVEGMIRAYVREERRGLASIPAAVDHAYRSWLATQGGQGGLRRDGWLIEVPGLWSRRDPDATCLAALEAKPKDRFGDLAANEENGAAAIARITPAGLLLKKPFEKAGQIAALTHGHPSAIATAGWLASWVDHIAGGQGLRDAAVAAWADCRGRACELDAALARAFEMAGSAPDGRVPAALGVGWVAEDVGAIALWCVLTATTPVEALRLAVNIDGDSCAAGALVGQILGAARGAGWIPPQMLDQLELREVMETLAVDATPLMTKGGFGACGVDDDAFWTRYPGW